VNLRGIAAGAALACLLAVACTRDEKPKQPEGTLRVLLGSDIATLDPHVSVDSITSIIVGNVFEPLVRFDRSLRLVGGLAERWINPDERTWRFFLDRRARFHDGTPLRASDVKFSVERLLSLPGTPVAAFVRHIRAVEAIDDHTVDIRTDAPVAILNDMAFVPIVSERSVRAAGGRVDDKPLGSGRYRVARWERGRAIDLEASEFARDPAAIARVEVELLPQEGMLERIEAGKPDLTLLLRQSVLDTLEKRNLAGQRLLASPGLYVFYLGFNTRATLPSGARNPLADVRLRRALVRATDQAAIVEHALRGHGRGATQLVVPEVFGFDPTLPATPVDPATARQMVDAAGHAGVELSILTVEGGSGRIEEELARQWERAGVKLTRREVPERQLAVEVAAGRFDTYIEGWGCTSADAAELLSYLLHSRDEARGLGTGNYYGFAHPEIDRIAETNLGVFDPRRRLALLQRALRLASEEAVFLPLYSQDEMYLLSDRLDWQARVDGEVRFEEMRLSR
jgi:peptide/nickel transport system substrate-binding protein